MNSSNQNRTKKKNDLKNGKTGSKCDVNNEKRIRSLTRCVMIKMYDRQVFHSQYKHSYKTYLEMKKNKVCIIYYELPGFYSIFI